MMVAQSEGVEADMRKQSMERGGRDFCRREDVELGGPSLRMRKVQAVASSDLCLCLLIHLLSAR